MTQAITQTANKPVSERSQGTTALDALSHAGQLVKAVELAVCSGVPTY